MNRSIFQRGFIDEKSARAIVTASLALLNGLMTNIARLQQIEQCRFQRIE